MTDIIIGFTPMTFMTAYAIDALPLYPFSCNCADQHTINYSFPFTRPSQSIFSEYFVVSLKLAKNIKLEFMTSRQLE